MRRVGPDQRHAAARGGRLDTRLGGRGLALAGPVHGDLHALRAVAPLARVRPARATFDAQVSDRNLAAEAAAYRRTLHRGDPVGRLVIPRLGLNMVVVQGTDEGSLRKGPGHYIPSALPGQGRLVYVAGHRTTYLAPFAKINDLQTGDPIRFVLPYGTFTYRVTRHFIVPASDVGVLRDGGRDVLRLQACHPRFFATHRFIVDAKLVSVVTTTTRAT